MKIDDRKTIAILRSEDFDKEQIPTIEEIITPRLDRGEILFVEAAVDGDNEIFRLFCRLNERYPKISFFSVLSKDSFLTELAQSGKDDLIEKGLISFDVALTAQTPEKAEAYRDIDLIDCADIVICRKGSRFDDPSFIKRYSLKKDVEIIAL